MTAMTYAFAAEYVAQAIESESEQRAEYGSGCVSLGYDPSDWATAYEGYRTSDDPMFAAAQRLLHDRYEVVRVITPAMRRADTDNDVPF